MTNPIIPAARPLIGDEEREAVDRVMRSGMLAQGPEVAAFEAEFAALVSGAKCVAVNSGTSALHLALIALGVGRGDEVLVPSFTFAASANSGRCLGQANIVFYADPFHSARIKTRLSDDTDIFGAYATAWNTLSPIGTLSEKFRALDICNFRKAAASDTLRMSGVFASTLCFTSLKISVNASRRKALNSASFRLNKNECVINKNSL